MFIDILGSVVSFILSNIEIRRLKVEIRQSKEFIFPMYRLSDDNMHVENNDIEICNNFKVFIFNDKKKRAGINSFEFYIKYNREIIPVELYNEEGLNLVNLDQGESKELLFYTGYIKIPNSNKSTEGFSCYFSYKVNGGLKYKKRISYCKNIQKIKQNLILDFQHCSSGIEPIQSFETFFANVEDFLE